jgi:2-methylisocitrate lyase-like PEP mutase family enzyme
VQIIARTDAIAVEGLDSALDRARRYADAGAHILFVEAPESRDRIERIADRLAGFPLLLNMFEGGRTPRIPLPELAEMGYRIVIIPPDLQRAAMRAMQDVAAEIFARGDSHAMADRLASFDDRDRLVDKESWDRRERRAGQALDGAGATA